MFFLYIKNVIAEFTTLLDICPQVKICANWFSSLLAPQIKKNVDRQHGEKEYNIG